MKIAIDARLWKEAGLGRYIRNLITHLQDLDTKNEYFILLLKKDYDILLYQSNFHKVLADFKWYGVSEQVKLSLLLKSLNPDLVHFPHFNVPLLYKGKYIVTIHDLIHQHFQIYEATTHGPLIYRVKSLGLKLAVWSIVKNSSKILVPSEFVKKQLIDQWKVKEDKITVTYEGVDESFLNLIKSRQQNDFQKVAKKFVIQKPYLFYVGNAHPHKNIPLLIGVFNELKNKFFRLSLVLSGPDNYFWQNFKKMFSPRGCIYTGFVTDSELVELYKNAAAFIMPSLEEGFGIPILEAMACGCPVVSSKAASLPEVGGDAAIYFDPKDKEDMIKKIEQVLIDEKLRVELVYKGLKRYQQFSWKKMAEQTLKVYENV